MSTDNLEKLIKDHKIEFIDLRFTDMRGVQHHVTFPKSIIEPGLFEDGKMFDGSSISGWKGIQNSDMVLLPDASTAFVDPFTAAEFATRGVVARLFKQFPKSRAKALQTARQGPRVHRKQPGDAFGRHRCRRLRDQAAAGLGQGALADQRGQRLVYGQGIGHGCLIGVSAAHFHKCFPSSPRPPASGPRHRGQAAP